MSSVTGVVVAIVLGIVLAIGSAIGAVQLTKQTPANTAPVSKPLVDYGNR